MSFKSHADHRRQKNCPQCQNPFLPKETMQNVRSFVPRNFERDCDDPSVHKEISKKLQVFPVAVCYTGSGKTSGLGGSGKHLVGFRHVRVYPEQKERVPGGGTSVILGVCPLLSEAFGGFFGVFLCIQKPLCFVGSLERV